MSLRHYIKDKRDNVIVFYVKTEKENDGLYHSKVYNVIDRSYANTPYYDIQWNNTIEILTSSNIFKGILNHNKLIRKWEGKAK